MSDSATIMSERDAPPARPARRARSLSLSWAGLIPFFLFSAMFLGLPQSIGTRTRAFLEAEGISKLLVDRGL